MESSSLNEDGQRDLSELGPYNRKIPNCVSSGARELQSEHKRHPTSIILPTSFFLFSLFPFCYIGRLFISHWIWFRGLAVGTLRTLVSECIGLLSIFSVGLMDGFTSISRSLYAPVTVS